MQAALNRPLSQSKQCGNGESCTSVAAPEYSNAQYLDDLRYMSENADEPMRSVFHDQLRQMAELTIGLFAGPV